MLKFIWELLVKFILWLLSFLFIAGISLAQDDNKPLLLGNMTWDEWESNLNIPDSTAKTYFPNEANVAELKKLCQARNINFQLFGGSWCKDSETEMPKIIKLYRLLDLGLYNIGIIGVDKDKSDPTGEARRKGITKVPTLIVIEGEKEIGRIVESPKKSWDDDILQIVKK